MSEFISVCDMTQKCQAEDLPAGYSADVGVVLTVEEDAVDVTVQVKYNGVNVDVPTYIRLFISEAGTPRLFVPQFLPPTITPGTGTYFPLRVFQDPHYRTGLAWDMITDANGVATCQIGNTVPIDSFAVAVSLPDGKVALSAEASITDGLQAFSEGYLEQLATYYLLGDGGTGGETDKTGNGYDAAESGAVTSDAGPPVTRVFGVDGSFETLGTLQPQAVPPWLGVAPVTLSMKFQITEALDPLAPDGYLIYSREGSHAERADYNHAGSMFITAARVDTSNEVTVTVTAGPGPDDPAGSVRDFVFHLGDMGTTEHHLVIIWTGPLDGPGSDGEAIIYLDTSPVTPDPAVVRVPVGEFGMQLPTFGGSPPFAGDPRPGIPARMRDMALFDGYWLTPGQISVLSSTSLFSGDE